MGAGQCGHTVFLIGIPSSGKSSAAAEIAAFASTFRVLTVDEVIRRYPQSQWMSLVPHLFDMAADEAEGMLQASNVVVDAVWSAQEVARARERFGESAMFVLLRITEAERRRREARRTDRKVHHWPEAWNDRPGPDHLYDHVIHTEDHTPAAVARLVLDAATERWPHLIP